MTPSGGDAVEFHYEQPFLTRIRSSHPQQLTVELFKRGERRECDRYSEDCQRPVMHHAENFIEEVLQRPVVANGAEAIDDVVRTG